MQTPGGRDARYRSLILDPGTDELRMTDIWAGLNTADEPTVHRLAETLELRAAEARQRAMLEDYLALLPFCDGARVLEVGSGIGAIARVLARWKNVGEVVGVDLAPVLVDRASQLAVGIDNLRFQVADGRQIPFGEHDFDVVVFHTMLCHLPKPRRAIEEAYKVLRNGGWLSVFDGDYTTITVALNDQDPLQAYIDAVIAAGLENRWLVRELPSLVRTARFEVRGCGPYRSGASHPWTPRQSSACSTNS
jgi:SAM-dependent methyltransferase